MPKKNDETIFEKQARLAEENSKVEEIMKKRQADIAECSEELGEETVISLLMTYLQYCMLPQILFIARCGDLSSVKPTDKVKDHVSRLGHIVHEVALWRINLKNRANND